MVALVFGGGLIAFTDQARDMVLASIAPDASFGSKLAVVGSVSFWAFSSWIWSRAALDAGFKMRRDLPGLASWQKGWITILCNHVPRVIGAASIAAVALAFQSGYAAYRDAGATVDAQRYSDYAIYVSVLAVVFYLVLAIRKYYAVRLDQRVEEEKWQAARREPAAIDDKTKETKTWRRVHSALNGLEWAILGASLVAFGLCSYWFATDPVAAAAFFGNSINVVLVGLALLTPVLGTLVLLSEWSRRPVFGTVVILTALMPEMTHDHHDVRLCEPGGDKSRCADPGYPAATRLDLHQAFVKWWDYNAKPDMFAPLAKDFPDDWRTPPLIVVATAGGASRAAFWTSLVLGELSAREERFADRTFLISGVSGGSLGATLFRSLVEEDRLRHSGQGSPLLTSAPRDAERFVQRDFLGPALGAGLFVDLPIGPFSYFTGREKPNDRAAALEKSWEAAWLASAGRDGPRKFQWDNGFLKVFRESERIWPILALNGTSVVKGKRSITSNAELQVSAAGEPDTPNLTATMSQSEGRYEIFRMLNADIPISTAVTMSARFPGVSPTGGLKDRAGVLYGRVTDGGLFENFGAMTADEVLRHLGSRIREAQWWRNDPTRKPVLPFVIVISSDPSLDPLLSAELPMRPHMTPDCDPVDEKSDLVVSRGNRRSECPTPLLHHSSLLTDPLRALYSGRVERGQSAVAALFDRTKDLIRYTYEGLNTRIDEKATNDKQPKDGFRLVSGQFSNVNDVPFFHFRQCRLQNRKGPTMSWHDSHETWEAMRIMTGLNGSNDPINTSPTPKAASDADQCGNAAEFLRLCIRLTMMTGVLDRSTNTRRRPADPQDASSLAREDCEKRWPKPPPPAPTKTAQPKVP